MKNSYGLPQKTPAKTSSTDQSYLGYLTQKQLLQLNKYKKDQESDKDSLVSGYSSKGRRMKLRHVHFIFHRLSVPLTQERKDYLLGAV